MSESNRPGKVEEVRKQIGDAAAKMLEAVRADYRKQQLENVALARECIELRTTVTAAMAAFGEPARAYRGTIERLENLKTRLEAVDTLAGGLSGWTARRTVLEASAYHRALSETHAAVLAEWVEVANTGRLVNRLPWRRRRERELHRMLWTLGLVSRSLGLPLEGPGPDAAPTQQAAAGLAHTQRVIE